LTKKLSTLAIDNCNVLKGQQAASSTRTTEGYEPRTEMITRVEVRKTPCILHYINAGFKQWIDKYRRLGNFSDYWFGSIPVGLQFHLDSRDLIARNNTKQMSRLYRRIHVLEDHKKQEKEYVNMIFHHIVWLIDGIDALLEEHLSEGLDKNYVNTSRNLEQ